MDFVKLQGTGNDFVCLDCFEQPPPSDPSRLARVVCRRRFGVGADGLILILPDAEADARMRIFNADGSEAEMCGNGLRCVAKELYETGRVSKTRMRIATGRGVLEVEVLGDGRVEAVKVNMGEPVLEARRIPTKLPGTPPLEVPVPVEGRTFRVSAVSMGNPHCVVFLEEPLEGFDVERYGRGLECSEVFPRRTNVEFVRVVRDGVLEVRVWERGAGETLACGTGACATAVVAALTGRSGRCVEVRLPGGPLALEWAPDGCVYMTGPARRVYRGQLDRELLEEATS